MDFRIFAIHPDQPFRGISGDGICESRVKRNRSDIRFALDEGNDIGGIHVSEIIDSFGQYVCQDIFLAEQPFGTGIILCFAIGRSNGVFQFSIQ